MVSAGVLLISGLVLGLAAAGIPSLGPVWNERPPAQLLSIADRKRAWVASSVLFAAGLITALFGVLVLSGLLIDAGAAPSGWIGMGAFVVGTCLWLIHLGYRMTVMVSVADDMAEGAAMPDWLLPTWTLGNFLLASYVLLASAGLIGISVGILETNLLPAWSAWVAIGLAVLFLATLAAFRNTMPVLPHLATGLLGIVAVLN